MRNPLRMRSHECHFFLGTITILLTRLAAVHSGRPDPRTGLPNPRQQKNQAGPEEAGQLAHRASSEPSSTLVCWKSSDHGGYRVSTPQNSEGIPGVAVIGPGCSRCVTGATCSFTISISPPANWLAPPSEPQRRELNIEMVGPTVVAPLVAPATPDDSSFLVTYRVWDAGVYRMSIRSSCGNLNYSVNPDQEKPHEMATWQLEVVPPAQEETSSRWTAYPCAGYADLSPEEWPAALNKKGIYEINFIGDSHQRALMMHLRFLISGEVEISHRRMHYAFTYVVRGKGGQLRLNFEWMAGIYVTGTELGCSMEGRGHVDPRYPEETPAADAWVVEAGYWTGQYCRQPESALATYLPQFLLWARGQVANSTNNPDRLRRRNARKQPVFAYRPTPPRDTEDKGCQTQFTNKYVRAANSIERTLAPHFGAVLFNSWEIEAARFRSHCPRDHHFSCPFQVQGKEDQFFMGGDVGEADAYALVYFLLKQ